MTMLRRYLQLQYRIERLQAREQTDFLALEVLFEEADNLLAALSEEERREADRWCRTLSEQDRDLACVRLAVLNKTTPRTRLAARRIAAEWVYIGEPTPDIRVLMAMTPPRVEGRP